MLDWLKGKKTYLLALVLALVVAIEKGLGIDIPGVVVTDDWMETLLAAAGLSALRAGISKNGW
jgi:hypothetical protein